MNTENSISLYFCFKPFLDNPGQNFLGHLRKFGSKMHFAKLLNLLIFYLLKKLGDVVIRGYFCCPPLPPSNVDCVELKLEYRTSTLHRGGKGGEDASI